MRVFAHINAEIFTKIALSFTALRASREKNLNTETGWKWQMTYSN